MTTEKCPFESKVAPILENVWSTTELHKWFSILKCGKCVVGPVAIYNCGVQGCQ